MEIPICEKRKGMGSEKRRRMGCDQIQRCRKSISSEEGCYLQGLPDDLLLNILGRLNFIDAATTSLQSRRLFNVWTFSPRLDFEDDQSSLPGKHFMKFVSSVMDKHQGTRVDFLRIAFDTVGMEDDDDVQGHLETWAGFVRSKCVRSLELDLNRTHVSDSPAINHHFPFCFPLRELYHLRTLTSLSLKYVSIHDEDDIVHLLEGSLLNLETLVIENASFLQNMKITALKLKQLEIRYCPELRSIDIISAPNLQSIELNRSVYGSSAIKHSPFGFPIDMFNGLSKLISLSLSSIFILDEDIVYVLHRCLNLEVLVVENSPHLKNVKVSAQKLKHLKIQHCPKLCSIDIISAPNLQFFEMAEDFQRVVRVSFCGNVAPKLSNVYLRGILCQNVLSELQEYAPCMEKLEMDMELICYNKSHSGCYIRYPSQFPQLRNLRQLVLKYVIAPNHCMMDLLFIPAACPHLENLTLMYFSYGKPSGVYGKESNHWGKRSCTHHSLKTVEFVGWCGLKNEVELANYLMDMAINLEKVTFNLNSPQHMDPSWRFLHSPVERKEGDWVDAALSAQELLDDKSNLAAHDIVFPWS